MQPSSAPRANKRALLIEPQRLFAPYFVATLESCGLDVVGVRARAVMRDVRALAPDVIVVDAAHRNGAPLAAIRALRKALPLARIVVYSRAAESVWPSLARSLGADIVIGPRARECDLSAALAA
ncbi:MAG: hypothetical protein NVS3B16_14210 [Vulcanimicrobiaceae bacterium]